MIKLVVSGEKTINPKPSLKLASNERPVKKLVTSRETIINRYEHPFPVLSFESRTLAC